MSYRLMSSRFAAWLLLSLVFASAGSTAHAEIKLPAIFGSHMVLQENQTLPVWGTADPGEAVTVTIGEQVAKTTTDSFGKWRVDLKPMAESKPLSLTVSGKNTLKLDDVLIGDVWICSGQSNMEFALHTEYDAGVEIAKANEPQIRLFVVPHKIALEPQTDAQGQWEICTPETAGKFSAVGYFFGRELQHSLNRPIGLVESSWGGMPAQAFTSLSGLQKDPAFTNYIEAFQTDLANYPKATAAYPALLAAYTVADAKWKQEFGPGYTLQLQQWMTESAKAVAAGQFPPPKPLPSTPEPKAPFLPEGAPNTPTVLFNGMIAPVIPFAIKGAIWYQGEANASNGTDYGTLFPRMISDWREKWGEGDFPFLYVQLANFMKPQVNPSENGGWPQLREAQLKTLSLPNTGMAVIIDIGEATTVHPRDKYDVGMRLALAAKHVAYGQDLVYSGPIYDSMRVEGKSIRLIFKHTGTGLKIGTPPWTPTGKSAPEATELTGFAIAGGDKNWVWAKAKIVGADVVVSSDDVAAPVAVRYGWGNNPACNLYNMKGLPAAPFRTDDWPPSTPAPMTTPAPPVVTPKT